MHGKRKCSLPVCRSAQAGRISMSLRKAILPYWGSETESSLFTIFVLPQCQGKGVGRKIIETLERDEYFLRAKRVEVPASITGVGFYRKLGYEYKNGIDRPDEERLYRLEKFRNIKQG